MTGSLSILNTGAGDIVVTFNDHDDAEIEKAIAMLEDMQKRGYAILVRQDDGSYTRAVAIDRTTKSYVVVPPPLGEAASADEPTPPTKRGRRARGRVPIGTRVTVAVARSAGGCAPRAPSVLLTAARSGRSHVD